MITPSSFYKLNVILNVIINTKAHFVPMKSRRTCPCPHHRNFRYIQIQDYLSRDFNGATMHSVLVAVTGDSLKVSDNVKPLKRYFAQLFCIEGAKTPAGVRLVADNTINLTEAIF